MSRFLTILIAAPVAMLLAGCHIPPDAPENRGLLGLKHDVATSPADGFAIVNVTATVDPVALPLGSAVVFTTSAGTFGPSATSPSGTSLIVPVDPFSVAIAQLRAPTDSALARLTATMNGVTRYDSVPFTRAFPDRILLATDHAMLQVGPTSPPNNSAKLTAATWRALGSPSPGQLIMFKAYVPGDTTRSRGTLSPALAISNNVTAPTVMFFADSAAVGVVRVRAQMIGANQRLIADSIDIQVLR